MATQQKIAQHVGTVREPITYTRSICALRGNKSLTALCVEETPRSPAKHIAEDGIKRPRFELGGIMFQKLRSVYSVSLQYRSGLSSGRAKPRADERGGVSAPILVGKLNCGFRPFCL